MNQHEEMAMEIRKQIRGLVGDVWVRCHEPKVCDEVTEKIMELVASAEKKGREEGKNLLKACESAQHSIWKRVDDAYEDGWNDAILAAREVAEESDEKNTMSEYAIYDKGHEDACRLIAESINQLKRG